MALKPCQNCGEEVKQRYASKYYDDRWLCAECRDVEKRPPHLEETEEELQEFLETPQGKARAAFESGAKLFQIDLPVSKTTGYVIPMSGIETEDTNLDNVNLLEAIESEGWKLENTGYVFRMKEIVSRDKFLSSGQQEAISGEIVGIYIFRKVEENKSSANDK